MCGFTGGQGCLGVSCSLVCCERVRVLVTEECRAENDHFFAAVIIGMLDDRLFECFFLYFARWGSSENSSRSGQKVRPCNRHALRCLESSVSAVFFISR